MNHWTTEILKALQLLEAMGAGATAERGRKALEEGEKEIACLENDVIKATQHINMIEAASPGFWRGAVVGGCVGVVVMIVAWGL